MHDLRNNSVVVGKFDKNRFLWVHNIISPKHALQWEQIIEGIRTMMKNWTEMRNIPENPVKRSYGIDFELVKEIAACRTTNECPHYLK